MALTRSITRPVFAGLFGAVEGGGGVTRNIIRLNRSLQQYFTFNTQTATGDFEFQVDIYSLLSAAQGITGKNGTSSKIGNTNNFNGNTFFVRRIKNNLDEDFINTSSGLVVNNKFFTINLKRVNVTVTLKVNGVIKDTGSCVGDIVYDLIGNIPQNGNEFNGYIKDFHLISGFTNNQFFKLDETLAGSSAIVDSNGGSAGAMVNGGSAYSEPFTLNTAVSPNVWVNNDGSISLPVAGT